MIDHWQSAEDRILELLADQTTFGLGCDEQKELKSLINQMPDFDHDCMQRLAATVHLANAPKKLQPLPAPLHQQIRANVSQSQAVAADPGCNRRPSEG